MKTKALIIAMNIMALPAAICICVNIFISVEYLIGDHISDLALQFLMGKVNYSFVCWFNVLAILFVCAIAILTPAILQKAKSLDRLDDEIKWYYESRMNYEDKVKRLSKEFLNGGKSEINEIPQ